MSDLHLSIGVTGHRDLVAEELPVIEKRLRAFFGGLQRDYPELPIQLISPLAEGGDQLAAEVALSMGIDLVTVLPMVQSEYERDFSSEETLAEFRDLLAKSHDVIVLPSCRGNGIVGRMLEQVEELARERGCCKLTLEVLEGNEAARQAYRKAGFTDYMLLPETGRATFQHKLIG